MASMRRSHRRLMHWLGVGGVAILSVTVFNIAADRLGDVYPPLRQLNDYTTRRAS